MLRTRKAADGTQVTCDAPHAPPPSRNRVPLLTAAVCSCCTCPSRPTRCSACSLRWAPLSLAAAGSETVVCKQCRRRALFVYETCPRLCVPGKPPVVAGRGAGCAGRTIQPCEASLRSALSSAAASSSAAGWRRAGACFGDIDAGALAARCMAAGASCFPFVSGERMEGEGEGESASSGASGSLPEGEDAASSTEPAKRDAASCFPFLLAGASGERTEGEGESAPSGASGSLPEGEDAASSTEPAKRDAASCFPFLLAGASGERMEGEGESASSASDKRDIAARFSFESGLSAEELTDESWSRKDDTMLCRTAYCAWRV
jgi:hypothetical protein